MQPSSQLYVFSNQHLEISHNRYNLDYEDRHLFTLWTFDMGVDFRSPTIATLNPYNFCVWYPLDMANKQLYNFKILRTKHTIKCFFLSVLGVITYIMWSFYTIKYNNSRVVRIWGVKVSQFCVRPTSSSWAWFSIHCMPCRTPRKCFSLHSNVLWFLEPSSSSTVSEVGRVSAFPTHARFSSSTTVTDPEALKESAPSKLLGMRDFTVIPLIPFFRLHPWVLGQAARQVRVACILR